MSALRKLVETPIGTGWKELQTQAAVELVDKDKQIAELIEELQTTATHKMQDGSFCWCDKGKAKYRHDNEFTHSLSCYKHRLVLENYKK